MTIYHCYYHVDKRDTIFMFYMLRIRLNNVNATESHNYVDYLGINVTIIISNDNRTLGHVRNNYSLVLVFVRIFFQLFDE